MFDHSSPTFSAKERIEVLFKEYDTLRAEIIARTAGGYQLITVSAILVTILVTWRSGHGGGMTFYMLLGFFVLVGFLFLYVTHRDINILAGRIVEIEGEINGLMSMATNALKWETEFGAGATGWFRRKLKGGDKPRRQHEAQ